MDFANIDVTSAEITTPVKDISRQGSYNYMHNIV